MKKLFIIVMLSILIIPGFLTANEIIPADEEYLYLKQEHYNKVIFVFQNKIMGLMSISQFRELVLAAERDSLVSDAEEKGRVVVTLLDNPWNIIPGEEYKTKAKIEWFSKKEVIKTVTIEVILKRNGKDQGWTMEYLKIYDKVARYGFPTALLIIIIILLL